MESCSKTCPANSQKKIARAFYKSDQMATVSI